MKDTNKTKKQLIKELGELKKRITELEKAEREWKKAEEELQESNELKSLLMESFPNKIFLKDTASVYVFCNSYYAMDLGISPEEIRGKTDYDFFPRDLADKYRSDDQRIMASGQLEQIKENYRIGDEEHTVLTVKVPVRDVDGSVIGILGIFTDITERKRAEKVQTAIFRISEATPSVQNLEELFHSIHAIISELMPAGNFYIAVYNESTEKVGFPYFVDKYDKTPAPKKLGRGLTEYVLRTGKPLLAPRKAIEDLAKKGKIEIFGTLPICWLGVPLKILEKTIGVLVVQSYTEDVTFGEEEKDILSFVSEQVAMAIERKRAEEARRKSEEQHRKVIENIFKFVPDGLLVFTDKLNLFTKNKTFQDIVKKYSAKLNYTEQELTEIIIEQVKNRIINEGYAEIRISKKQG
ncbi:MAG: PAS domain-containing protein [bacterium]|nr:PAS domain-containing protein [bacterium]